MRMPAQPISAISFHAARSKPSGLPPSRSLRNAVTGDFSCTHDFAESRIIVCSSFRTAISSSPVTDVSISLMVEKTEYALGDDVVLDFKAPAVDGRSLSAEPRAHRVELVARKAFTFPAQSAVTHDLDEKLRALLTDPG